MGFVYVARHGETEWNRAGRYQGQRESMLTSIGHSQAHALAHAFDGSALGRIVSSPLARCVRTAEPLAARRGFTVETDALLLEIDHGDWEGRLRSEIEADDPELLQTWRERPDRVQFRGGERLADVRERWRTFIRSLDGKTNVVVVTHDVLVRIAILEATGRPLSQLWEPRVVNGGFATLWAGDDGLQLRQECSAGHLKDLVVDVAQQAL